MIIESLWKLIQVYTSVGLQYQWFWVESLPVRGITSSTTIGDIIRWLDSLNCTFIATGESAWQTLQRAKPLAISGETSCSIDKVSFSFYFDHRS